MFDYEKNNPAQRAGEKTILLPFCPEKNFCPDQKSKPPPPEYQMDRALFIAHLSSETGHCYVVFPRVNKSQFLFKFRRKTNI